MVLDTPGAALSEGLLCQPSIQHDRAHVRFYWSKWVTFSCAAVLMVSAGLPYAFSIYGAALQKALHLSNSRLSTLGAFSNAGGYTALGSGMAFDYLIRWKRGGPKICVLIGCICYVVGFYGLYWNAVSGDSSKVQFWVLCILSFIASNGGTWLEAAALSTTLRNFETHRGPVVGILKAFLGLSASIYTTLYVTFCERRLDVLWLLAVVPSSCCVVAGMGVNLVPFRQAEKTSKEHAFHIALYATLSMAIYQLVTGMYFTTYSDGHPLRDIPNGVGLLMCCAVLLLMVPIVSLPLVFGGVRALPIAEELQSTTWWGEPQWSSSRNGAEVGREPCSVRLNLPTPALPDNDSDTDEGFLSTSKVDFTVGQCLKTLDYWLLCLSFSITTGTGLAFINSASTMSHSLNGNSSLISVIVSNFSVFNCIGRMATTFLPDKMWKTHIARTDFLVVGSLFSAACSLLAAWSTKESLPLIAISSGCTFGFLQALAPTIVSELFGLKFYASNYASLTTMFTFSSFTIANGLMSWNYGLYSNHHIPPTCHGPRCYRLGFYICAGLCIIACLLSVILTIRRKGFYLMMYKAVRRETRMRGFGAVRLQREKMHGVLLKRLDKAANISHKQMNVAQARKERLSNLTRAGGSRVSPEQLIESWQEEYKLLEQSMDHVDSVLHGYDAELNENVGQSFISELSSSTFRFQM